MIWWATDTAFSCTWRKNDNTAAIKAAPQACLYVVNHLETFTYIPEMLRGSLTKEPGVSG
jgi:hypothetical protein